MSATLPIEPGRRRTLTVVFTDVVGSTERTCQDEENVIARIDQDLDFFRKEATAFEGRVLKKTGDGLMLVFESAVNAMRWAKSCQAHVDSANRKFGAIDVFHRFGVHLGDIIKDTDESGDYKGDGANLARRLEEIAGDNCIAYSRPVQDATFATLKLDHRNCGKRVLKGKAVVEVLMIPSSLRGVDPFARVNGLQLVDGSAIDIKPKRPSIADRLQAFWARRARTVIGLSFVAAAIALLSVIQSFVVAQAKSWRDSWDELVAPRPISPKSGQSLVEQKSKTEVASDKKQPPKKNGGKTVPSDNNPKDTGSKGKVDGDKPERREVVNQDADAEKEALRDWIRTNRSGFADEYRFEEYVTALTEQNALSDSFGKRRLRKPRRLRST